MSSASNDTQFHELVNAALKRYAALWKGGKAPTFNCKDRAPEELCNLTPEDSLMLFGRLNATGEHAKEILRGVWRNQYGMVECPSGINYSPEMEG